jgi:hypothetical protein
MVKPNREAESRGNSTLYHPEPTQPDGRAYLIHCSYHKCLTVYYRRVMDAVFNRLQPWGRGYRHFNSHLEDFYENFRKYRIASVNNRSLDLTRLGEFRITRFLRDPRDLVVSGYFYHKRGAEPWTRLQSPTPDDWYFANGFIPEGLRRSRKSFADYLQSLSLEEGLLAELEFRTLHFESMARWPDEHPHILTQRYEDILGLWFVNRYSLDKRSRDTHVRNPAAGQWREHFTPRVKRAFDSRYGELTARLGYAEQ